MRFCDVEKIGLVCDTYTPKTETRRDDEVRVIMLTLRIEPLTREIAAGIDAFVRRTLFRNDGDPVPTMREVIFALDIPRQLIRLQTTRDSNGTLALDQVKIGRLPARLSPHGRLWTAIVNA